MVRMLTLEHCSRFRRQPIQRACGIVIPLPRTLRRLPRADIGLTIRQLDSIRTGSLSTKTYLISERQAQGILANRFMFWTNRQRMATRLGAFRFLKLRLRLALRAPRQRASLAADLPWRHRS